MGWKPAARATPRRSRRPEDVIRWRDRRCGIQRAGRNHHDRAVAPETWNRAPAMTAKPLTEALCRGKVIAGDDVFPQQPSELAGINGEVGCVAGARAFTTS